MALGIWGMVGWIFFGFIIGLLARAIMPGRDPLGFLATTILGVLGALVGGLLGQALGFYQPGSQAGFIGAVVGALALLLIYRSYARYRAKEGVARAIRDGTPRSIRKQGQPEERRRSA